MIIRQSGVLASINKFRIWTDLFGLELLRRSFDHLGEGSVGLDTF